MDANEKIYLLLQGRPQERQSTRLLLALVSGLKKQKKDGFLKYGQVKRVLDSINSTLPPQMHINRYDLANHRKRAKMNTIPCSDKSPRKTVDVGDRGAIDRPKGGRSIGSTKEKKIG